MIYCLTGPRPQNIELHTIAGFKQLLEFSYEKLAEILKPEDTVLCGMQAGFDLAGGVAALKLGCAVHAIFPFTGFKPTVQGNIYAHKKYWNTLFYLICQKATKTIIVAPGKYEVWKLMKRNTYMVDKSETTIALWNGTSSGTSHCVQYANISNKKVINIYDDWVDFQAKDEELDEKYERYNETIRD